MTQATIKSSKYNLGHKINSSKHDLRHNSIRIESSEKLKDFTIYYELSIFYTIYTIYYILYFIYYTIYFYEVNPLCTQPYLYAYDPSHIFPNFTIFGTRFPYSQPTLTRVCYSHMHITALCAIPPPYDLPLISHSTLPQPCQPSEVCLLHHIPPPRG